MELYQLKTFVTIAREKNLTRAAKILHLSQSALSSQLKLLEGEFGVELFRRTARGMELTDNGQALLPQVRSLLEAASDLRQRAMSMSRGQGETVTIGLNASPAFLQAGALNRRLSLLHSEFSTIFMTSQSVNTAKMLRQNQIDLGFFYGGDFADDIQSEVITQVRFCVVIPSLLVVRGMPETWADIATMPWIWVGKNSPPYLALAERLARNKLIPNQAVTTEDEYVVKELVADGQGVALLREDEARPLVEAGHLAIWEKGWFALPLGLAWLESRAAEKRIQATADVIRYLWQSTELESGEMLADKYWV